MKILYVTTIAPTMGFFKKHFEMLISEENIIELACNCENPVPSFCIDMGLKVYDIPFSRQPFSKNNIIAAKQLDKIIQENNYDIVHTHTPNASVCVRWACRKYRKKGLKVFYTAHGFHFYKGAPLINWLLFYPVEWLCSFWTDKLITINHEDYNRSKTHFHAKEKKYIPGVGIDVSALKKSNIDVAGKRHDLGIPDNMVWIIAVGEINSNKNHITLINAVKNIPNVYLTIAGRGELEGELQSIINDSKLDQRIKLLGYRNDVSELYQAADIFCLPSIREGLSVALMEAMACGKPCVVSSIRGNVDLINEKKAQFKPQDVGGLIKALEWMLEEDYKKIGEQNFNNIQQFDISRVLSDMKRVYEVI